MAKTDSCPIHQLILIGILLGCHVLVDSLQSVSQSSNEHKASLFARRKFLTGGLVFSALPVGLLFSPQSGHAVAPITQYDTENGIAKVARLMRSKPPKILRQRIATDFAVLLMRSSYAITDTLDIIPMNQFQRDFFLIRSAEYENYVQSLGPGYVKQGDLTDPSYFDFISFAQYLTINRALSDPPYIFEELQPVTVPSGSVDETLNDSVQLQKFETVVIRRSLPNDRLIEEFDQRMGQAILQYIDDTYNDTASSLPRLSNPRPPVDEVEAGLTQLLKLFLVNGFAWEGQVKVVTSRQNNNPSILEDASGVTFCLTLVSPASVWGHESLLHQRCPLRNDYLLKTAKQLVQRMGYSIASSSIKFEGTSELSYLTLR